MYCTVTVQSKAERKRTSDERKHSGQVAAACLLSIGYLSSALIFFLGRCLMTGDNFFTARKAARKANDRRPRARFARSKDKSVKTLSVGYKSTFY